MNYEAFLKLSYGLYLISAKDGKKINGYIGNSVFQVTASPPQIAVSCNKNNYSANLLKSGKVFSISVLEQDAGAALIGLFGYQSGRETAKFESVEYIQGETGVPIVTQNAVAWFECKVVNEIDVGTHILFIGEVIANDLLKRDTKPLTYSHYREVRKGMAPENAPTYIDKSKINPTQRSEKHKCTVCGYVYEPDAGDPEHGIPKGTSFNDLPGDWKCPVCNASKDDFELLE